METLTWLSEHPASIKTVATVVIIAVILIGRALAVRTFEDSGMPPERRNRFLVQSRNIAILVAVGSVTVLWAQQLQTVALSLAALAAATVVATKELLLCLSGAFLRVSARAFRLGDRIEIQGHRGDVIDIGPLTTTLLEVGPDPTIHKITGRTVVLPNSLFLSAPVFNESFTEHFVLHSTTIRLPKNAQWEASESKLLSIAGSVCSPYLNDARDNMARVGRKHGLTPPDVTPRCWLNQASLPELELILRFPTPIRGRGKTEQAILRRFFATTAETQETEAGESFEHTRA